MVAGKLGQGKKKKNEKKHNKHYRGQCLFIVMYPNESVSKWDIREAVSSKFCKIQSNVACDNTCFISKHRSPVITNPWWFCCLPFVLKCLHDHSLVVIVISSCFGIKLQSKYASVCLKQLSVVYERQRKSFQNMSDYSFLFFSFFFFSSLFRNTLWTPGRIWNALMCSYTLFHAIFMVKHIYKLLQLFSGWWDGISKN